MPGAPIVNASFGTEPYRRPIPDDFHAVEAVFAAHPGTLFVTAAGNDANGNDQFPTLPCNAEASNVLCVGAYTPAHKAWDETNYGATSVDLSWLRGASCSRSTPIRPWAQRYVHGGRTVSGVAASWRRRIRR